MNKYLSVIKENIEYAKTSGRFSDNIIASQIEEFILLLDNIRFHEPNEVSDMFSDVFDLPLLSYEFLYFCISICKAHRFDSDNDIVHPDNGKVACLYNEYCETALKSFGRNTKLDTEFENDFNSVCEAVYLKRSSYALLPLYNTRDGLIVSLYKLLQKYDLHISASTRVLMADGITETEFFLVSNYIRSITGNPSTIFLSVISSADDTIPQLLYALCKCGISVKYINTLPVHYADDRTETIMMIDTSSVCADAVKLFLSAALPYSTVLGLYPIVK